MPLEILYRTIPLSTCHFISRFGNQISEFIAEMGQTIENLQPNNIPKLQEFGEMREFVAHECTKTAKKPLHASAVHPRVLT